MVRCPHCQRELDRNTLLALLKRLAREETAGDLRADLEDLLETLIE